MVNKLTYLVLTFLFSGCASTSKEDNKLGYNGLLNASPKNSGALQSLENLKSNPDAKFRIDKGWTIVDVNNEDEQSIYSFTPDYGVKMRERSGGDFSHSSMRKKIASTT